MLNTANTKVILGPPGTGKTSKLIALVEHHLSKGVLKSEVGFFAFTKKASLEAKERIKSKFNLKDEEIPYFKTLHSLAFQQLGIDKRNVMDYMNYVDICNMLGLTISSQHLNENGEFTIVHTKGDRLFFLENLARVTRQPLEAVWRQFPEDDIMLPELLLLETTLKDYKKAKNKVDFTDMILQFNYYKRKPNFKVLIIDEAQDLSPIQWEMVHELSENVPHVYLAGDDDQAIYNWAGADAQLFQGAVGERITLGLSYRLTPVVHAKAEQLISRVKNRLPKAYTTSKTADGKIQQHSVVDTIDMKEGTWLLLARNIFLLPEYSKYCLRKGYLFDSKYGSPVNPKAASAIKNWELLRRNANVTGAEAKEIYDLMSVKTRIKYGAKKRIEALDDMSIVNMAILADNYGLLTLDIWHKALDRLKPFEIEYFINALKHGEKMLREPRIKINTIHGVKGGEAQNVVIMLDMSKRTFEDYHKNPDDEIRVWYVGITRSSQNLYFINPQTPYYMDI